MLRALPSFGLMIVGALIGAVLGGGFGAGIAAISPEFINGLFQLKTGVADPIRYACAVGAVVGLFLGFAGMTLALGFHFLTRPAKEK